MKVKFRDPRTRRVGEKFLAPFLGPPDPDVLRLRELLAKGFGPGAPGGRAGYDTNPTLRGSRQVLDRGHEGDLKDPADRESYY